MELNGTKFTRAKTIDGQSWGKTSEVRVTGHFVDLTAIMERNGFSPIGPRGSFANANKEGLRHYSSAEWWHFEARDGLKRNETTYGSELEKAHTPAALKDSYEWDDHSEKVYNGTGAFTESSSSGSGENNAAETAQ